MKKKLIISTIVSAAVLFLSHWSLNYVGGNDGLGVLLLLWFVLCPLLSAALGIVGGTDFKHLWCIPVINGVLYLAAAWIFLAPFEMSFILYAVIYIAIGLVAALITSALKRRKN